MAEWEDKVERMQADGKITVHDADEVRNFASFLAETAGIPTSPRERTREQQDAFYVAYARHYPEDFERTDPALYALTLTRMESP